MTFRVIKQSRTALGSKGSRESLTEFVIVDDIEDKESALVLAEVVTLTHSEAIDVPYQTWRDSKGNHIGFRFTTNNHTYVWYTIKENS